MNVHSSSASTSDPIRDGTYYLQDGNCVLRAGDYLFKLHRSVLQMHSPFFQKMFSLPQDSNRAPYPASTVDGETDDQPIVCDDPPEAFRALCWVLYADPLGISRETKLDENNIDKLAYIGLLAHKYEFPAIEQWAIKLCRKIPKPEALMSSSTESLKLVLRTAITCGWHGIKTQLTTSIIDGVSNEKNPSAITTASTLSKALRVADHVNDDELRVTVYSAYLQSVQWNLNPVGRVNSQRSGMLQSINFKRYSLTETLSSLSEGEKLCLYRGYSSLLALRNQLRIMPALVEPLPAICAQAGIMFPESPPCLAAWRSWWSCQITALDKQPMHDGPVPLLRAMLQQAQTSPPRVRHLESFCLNHVKDEIAEMIEMVERDLHKYFAVVM